MELKFELGKTILYQLSIFDKCLEELGLPPVFQNSDFVINEESSSTFGLDVSLVRPSKNTIPVDFSLESGGLRIDIDGIPETFEWSNNAIEDPNDLIAFLRQLFTSFVLMEYCGSHTAMELFDSKGKSLFHTTLRYNGIFGSLSSAFPPRNCKRLLFFPIYDDGCRTPPSKTIRSSS